jgi:trehalose 6-phosphate phosphatase
MRRAGAPCLCTPLPPSDGVILVQTLRPDLDLATFYRRVASADERVLMLDYDGTLAPFHERPDQAVPYPEVPPLISALMHAGGTRVVIVSGRPAEELPPLLGLAERPEIWGVHGWERLLPDGSRRVEAPHGAVLSALDHAAHAVRRVMPPEARLEQKLASIALHWRGLAPGLASRLAREAREVWEEAVEGGVLELLPFDGGLELRALGCNKEHAVKAILAETTAGSAIAYLGDDLTDEDAFRAVKPHGLAVLVRPQLRETAADLWLQPPHELVEFLNHWLGRA